MRARLHALWRRLTSPHNVSQLLRFVRLTAFALASHPIVIAFLTGHPVDRRLLEAAIVGALEVAFRTVAPKTPSAVSHAVARVLGAKNGNTPGSP